MAAKKNWRAIIKEYVALLRQEIDVERAIVFGSTVGGRARPHSDLDVAIVSKHFRDRNEIADMQYLLKKAQLIDTRIEPHPYHPKELKKVSKGTLLHEILRTGKAVQ